jgi:hypothetical protein
VVAMKRKERAARASAAAGSHLRSLKEAPTARTPAVKYPSIPSSGRRSVCGARAARGALASARTEDLAGSDSDEPGLSAWRERFEAMLRAMRAVRRRSAAVRGLADAGDDVGRVAPKGEVEDGCLGMEMRTARQSGAETRRGGARLDVRTLGRRHASRAGLGSPHEASASLENGTHDVETKGNLSQGVPKKRLGRR